MQLSAKVTLMTSGKTKKEGLRVKCGNRSVEKRDEYSQEAWREVLFKVLVGFSGGQWSLYWDFQFNLIDL